MTPPKKRGRRGDGSIHEVGPKVWRLRVFLGNHPTTGKPVQASRTVHGTKTEALQALRRFVVEAPNRQTPAGQTHTMGALFDAWLEHLGTLGRAPTTIRTYRTVVEKHLRPALGRKHVTKVTGYDLDRYYAAQKAAELKPRTIRQHHAILSSAFTQAERWGWVASNPALRAGSPEVPRDRKRVPGVAEVRRLITACGDDVHLAMVVTVAAVTGCRRGELCGLQWSDVDWVSGTLRVERQRVPLAGGDRTVPLKHGEGRTVAVGELGVTALGQYRLACLARLVELQHREDVTLDPDWWLLSPDGEGPWRAQRLGEAVTALGVRAGVPVTTHAFRRFAATQLVAGGVDVVTAASRLGHTSDVLLRSYAGFLPERDRAAAGQLEATILGPSERMDP